MSKCPYFPTNKSSRLAPPGMQARDWSRLSAASLAKDVRFDGLLHTGGHQSVGGWKEKEDHVLEEEL